MNKFEKVSYREYLKSTDSTSPINTNYDPFWDEYNRIKLPKRATTGSAGYDFFSPFDFTLKAGESIKIPTSIRVLLDNDKCLMIYPRSGLGFKFKVQLWNSTGIIDSDYSNSDNEGHIFIKLYNDSPEGKTVTIKAGEAFCQGIITQYFVTDDDNTDGTRNGGFGSTTNV